VLFPLIGPAIRKAITSTLRNMLDSLNHTLDVGFSWRGLTWWLEALRTGKPFAEVVLLHTLHYRVEQVFLIHRDSGLLLLHATAKAVTPQDGDLVSGMLTAIHDFMRDSFGVQDHEALDAVQMGELSIWIEPGPQAIVAAVVRGHGSPDLRTAIQEAVEAIHFEQRLSLEDFDGNAAPFESSRHHLEACLLEQYRPRRQRTAPLLWIIAAAVVGGLAIWGVSAMQERQRWASFLERLRAEPGVVITSAQRRDGQYVLSGLRDPLAADPYQLLHEARLDPTAMRARWETYHALHPPFILHRAIALLSPPETVQLSLIDHILHAQGRAPHAWIVDAERLARLIPGVAEFRREYLLDTTLAALGEITTQIEQETLVFRKNTLQLVADQEAALERLGASLRRLHELAHAAGARAHILIRGHTDRTGDEGRNQRLSHERAEAILSALLVRGLPASTMSATGIGARSPLSDEVTEEDRALNRRVSFRVSLTGTAIP
jgi:OOP family OmpA-OmpF porin